MWSKAAVFLGAVFSLGGMLPCQTREISEASAANDERPIRKVINLLEEMKVQVQKDADADLTAYDKYMCWCETNIKGKSEAVKIAGERIEQLTAFLEESAAKIGELKTQIEALGKSIEEDKDALATATAVRKEENEAFIAEEKDMKETIALLDEAIKVLAKVQLLQKHGSAEKEAKKAANIMLQVSNVLQLKLPRFHRVMQRDLFDLMGSMQDLMQSGKGANGAFLGVAQPNALEGNAAGASSYNARSGGILGTLKAMMDKFSKDLASAQKAEMAAEDAFQKLRAAKLDEIGAASDQKDEKEALLADTQDKAAKAKEDIQATQDALSADQKMLLDMQESCKKEEEEYATRVKSRSEELQALGEALKILTSDDARDLYSKTMSFVQEADVSSGHTVSRARLMEHATKLIADVARKHHNYGMAFLATRVQLDAFKKVKEMMDKMLKELAQQQKDEYAKWELCKKDIDTAEDEIKVGENKKEDLSEKLVSLENTIATLTDEIAALKASVAEMQVSLKSAGETRKAENAMYQQSIMDQRATINILNKATERLRAFYGLNQVEVHMHGRQEPGAAVPPPPPKPKGYEKSAGAGGVMQLLAKIIADAEIVEQELQASEQQMQADYSEFVKSATASIDADRTSIEQKTSHLAEAKGLKSESMENQLANNAELEKLGELLKAHHLECDYIIKYFDLRQQARQEEMDAINDAKAILSGADFGKAATQAEF